jgi:prepilin peptidase CpaA
MGLTAFAAYWFLPAVVPISFYVAWSDMQRMKIPNIAVYALVISFAVLGLIALPFTQYLWHWTHLIVVLVVGFVLNMVRVLGAGDAKFMAGAAPFMATDDLPLILPLFAACLMAGLVTHRLVRLTPLRQMVPHWESWSTGRRFPMGFPLSMTLVFYLALIAIYR